ncbi:MAG: hypothetical protein U1E31_01110 [Rickettsiales bacterium]
MYILAIDTSAARFSAAISVCDNILSYVKSIKLNNHAEDSIILINKMLKELEITYKDISIISLMTGPGSNMGIKIGISIVNAISALYEVDIITIKNTELIFHIAKKQSDEYDYLIAMCEITSDKCYIEIMDKSNYIIARSENLKYSELDSFFNNFILQYPDFIDGIKIANGDAAIKYFSNIISFNILNNYNEFKDINILTKLQNNAEITQEIFNHKQIFKNLLVLCTYASDAKRMIKLTRLKHKNNLIHKGDILF